jgi:hypothetical protein
VKPGGRLVIDHYSDAKGLWTALGRIGTMQTPVRAVLKRLPPRLSLKAVIAIAAFCDPIRRRTANVRWLDRIASRVLPTLSYYREYPEIDRNVVRQWNELDTYDALTDYYKHFRSPEELARHLASLGFTDVHAVRGGNGVEARATAPGP